MRTMGRIGWVLLAASLACVTCGGDDGDDGGGSSASGPSQICRNYCDKFFECACDGDTACLQGCLNDCSSRDMGQPCMEEFINSSCDVLSC